LKNPGNGGEIGLGLDVPPRAEKLWKGGNEVVRLAKIYFWEICTVFFDFLTFFFDFFCVIF